MRLTLLALLLLGATACDKKIREVRNLPSASPKGIQTTADTRSAAPISDFKYSSPNRWT
jgi:hypothetical protein